MRISTLSTQKRAVTKTENVRKCGEKQKGDEEQLGVAKVAAKKARDDANSAMEEASRFEADDVGKLGHTSDKIDEWTKQLCKQAAFAAAHLIKLAAVHAKLESYEDILDALDEA